MPKLETAADQQYLHQLPKVSFRIVNEQVGPKSIPSEQIRHYGCVSPSDLTWREYLLMIDTDGSDFERPEHYIRYIEPIEAELAVQVEYDMDEQDKEWLDAVNAERTKDQSGPISYEVFEIIMDKLEKEWFNLIKRIPQPASHLPVEDSRCAVCDDGEGENSNAIVFCDGCNLAVHQDCYGVPYIPEGQWLCRKCTVSPENPVSCLFCPNEGGAFKQTTTGHWAHLLCAIWIPELIVGNPIYMEPVDGVETIPKNRWKLTCSLCREKVGACIQCADRSCFVAFHVTCARQHGLLMSNRTHNTDELLKAYCQKHLPVSFTYDARGSDNEDDLGSEYTEDDDEDEVEVTRPSRPRKKSAPPHCRATGPVTTKSARAHTKSYRPGPPIVPRMVVNKIEEYVAKISIRKRRPFLERVCRYWSLKREARRGAPLLKRLHLEPWTASSASRQQSEADKARKLKFLQKLRMDLDTVRTLCESVRKREKEKLRQTQVIKEIIDSFIFPLYGKLRITLDKISAMDKGELFLRPVNINEVPDYATVVKEPMCWLEIDDRLEKNTYLNIAEFKRDICLVLDNAMLYNNPDTPFHKTAKRIKNNAQPLLDELDHLTSHSANISQQSSNEPQSFPTVGDLEPSEMLLRCLLEPSKDDAGPDILGSIFGFALEKPKLPTPQLPSKTKIPKKVLTAAERKAKWEERDAKHKEMKERLGRSTRAAEAAEKALYEQVGYVPSSDHVDPESLTTLNRRRSGRVKLVETTEDQQSVPSVEGQSGDMVVRRQKGKQGKGKKKEVESGEVDKEDDKDVEGGDGDVEDVKPQHKIQRGVAGIETFAIMSDKERRKRERELELVTDQVDSQDLFKRFNIGWVLPEGSKRRRSERVEIDVKTPSTGKSVKPVSRSDLKETPISISRLNSGSLSPLPQSPDVRQRQAEPVSTSKKRKAPENVSASRTRKKSKFEPDVKTDSTPRTNKRKPVEEEEGEEEVDIDEEGEEVNTDEDEENEEEGSVQDTTTESMSKSRSGKKKGDEMDDEKYPNRTLVWAKTFSYPYFPAEILNPSMNVNEIPRSVMNKKPSNRKTWLVRFYDPSNSFAWIGEDRLDLLGESDEIDEMYNAGKERKGGKSFKTNHIRQGVRKAYKIALSQREVE
ncbi:hypothetical protein M231_07371 [Tremella mesenterica]|uniref:NuA3 HAT complex component NTO1 n=1 Tax=Tremella mesenterica TaxID=5217 RepID=A0A4Q1BFP8_TREME|nr:hypothetical protein M231_07371 [Tremella mesenterica]